MPAQYPQVEQLITTLEQSPIKLQSGKPSRDLATYFYRYIQIDFPDLQLQFPVMDEFEDVKVGNPLVLLHLLLQECEFFEEAADFNAWVKDVGFFERSGTVHDIYRQLQQKVPTIRRFLGKDIRAIPSYNMEFNNGIAQALRAAWPKQP